MSIRGVNSLVGGIFGLIYVLANTQSLPGGVAWALRGAAIAAFVGLAVVLRRRAHGPGLDDLNPFGRRGYRLLVAGEVAALVVGIIVLNGPLNSPRAVIGWVSLVVGVHFIVLASVWAVGFYRALGAVIAACGVAGLILSAGHASTPTIAVVAGIVPGIVLLAAGYRGALAASR